MNVTTQHTLVGQLCARFEITLVVCHGFILGSIGLGDHPSALDFHLPVDTALRRVNVVMPFGFAHRSLFPLPIRCPETHCLAIRLNSFSIMFNQLPCLGA